jgi:alkaline phosphatase D
VQGVYDDHDFGVNDVGSELGEHRERMDAFLDFIGASATDPRRTQEAIYSSHVYGPAHKQVKVCVLQCYHIALAHCLLACSSLAHTGESYIQNLCSIGCVCM